MKIEMPLETLAKLKVLSEEKKTEIVSQKKTYQKTIVPYYRVIEWLMLKEQQYKEKDSLINSIIRAQIGVEINDDKKDFYQAKLKESIEKLKAIMNGN